MECQHCFISRHPSHFEKCDAGLKTRWRYVTGLRLFNRKDRLLEGDGGVKNTPFAAPRGPKTLHKRSETLLVLIVENAWTITRPRVRDCGTQATKVILHTLDQKQSLANNRFWPILLKK
ncbi:hypothetical protein [Pseudomonas extremaustralis]